MQGQTERMQHLVDDLLLLTRLETQQKKLHCVDIPALLSQICKEGDDLESATRRIELTLESSAHIMGEEQELRSAFTNLLGNALKYSPEDTLVKLHWYQDANSVVLAITDMGEGISKTDIPRVTERFYRSEVKRAKKVIEIIEKIKPAVVIHAAAMTDVDGCELDNDKAYRINTDGTANVAFACGKTNSTLSGRR